MRKVSASVRLMVSGAAEADLIAAILQAVVNGSPETQEMGIRLSLQAARAGRDGVHIVYGLLSTGIDAPEEPTATSNNVSTRRRYGS